MNVLKRCLCLFMTLCCFFTYASAVEDTESGELSNHTGFQQEYYEWVVEQTCEEFDVPDASAGMIGGIGADGLGYFGAMWFWLQYETGCTDNSAFGNITLNDGLGGQAYGVQFDLDQGSLLSFVQYVYQSDPTMYAMFAPFQNSIPRASSLSDPFPTAWKEAFSSNTEDFIAKQKQYVIDNIYNVAAGFIEADGYDLSKRSDVVKGAILSYAHQHGPYSFYNKNILAAAGITNEDDDKTFIEKLYNYRNSVYGHYNGLDLYIRYNNEVKTALALQEQWESGAYIVADTAALQAVVAEASKMKNYDTSGGQCERWVEWVYQEAGTGMHIGTWCCAGHNRAQCQVAVPASVNQIPVGAMVYSDPAVYHNKGTLGSTSGDTNYGSFQLYGHVGIYLGNNTVISRGNTVYTETWDHWVSYYGNGGYGFGGLTFE